VVAVIGDGINDSPALALADVSISLRSGADVARETADVVLMRPKQLMSLAHAIQLSRDCMGLIRQNFALVAAPNATAIALATAGMLNPVAATLMNNGSTILAGMNSLRPLLAEKPAKAPRGQGVSGGPAPATPSPRFANGRDGVPA
jgi:Cu2+-exporting ATPase